MEDEAIPTSDSNDRTDNITLTGRQKALLVVAALLALILLAGLIWAVLAMVQHPDQTETIRDIVIIFMALEASIIGLALILLLVQLARLTALLQNEIAPLLDSANETLGTLRGTTLFLSDNLVRPVVKMNSSVSALKRAMDMIRSTRSRQRTKSS